ncbi:MAG: VanZ family protein [Alphaproteobacteria bacterium]|nr:VanZ family protein [Alphaproteobacteria bacterium]MBV9419309.1 VanZ family protein [Alphaproteobacteria bacterium]MBV9539976.1 VanZ family protein [Alphaproteobacteria bacterium]MBV9904305.1 VanZ family protein [Alphaproteobacteria bacterium]
MSYRKLLHWFRQLDVWLIVPAIALVTWGELAQAPLPEELEIAVWDKALHFTAYFGLALMTTIAVRADRRSLWWALALVVMGGALEVVQGLTGRDMDVFDEVANTLGVLAGLGLAWAVITALKARKLVEDPPPPD